jgi:hypothetical protein
MSRYFRVNHPDVDDYELILFNADILKAMMQRPVRNGPCDPFKMVHGLE